MASFAPNKIDLSQIHSGQRYQNGDIVSPEAINAPIEASAWAQETADKANKMSEEAVSKADQALNYGIGNTQGTFPVLTAYPIGAIFITKNPATNPAERFGGFWLRIKDAFLWASGDTASITYTKNGQTVTESLLVGSKGGEATHTLTVGEMPSHYHDLPIKYQSGGYRGIGTWADDSVMSSDGSYRSSNMGGGQAHNNMPPYYAVNAWVRVTEEDFNKNESL
jgi:hypothetical protein